MIWETANRCPLCARFSRFSEYKVKPETNLFKCNVCGLVLERRIWRKDVNSDLVNEWFGEARNLARPFCVSVFEIWNNKRTARHIRRFRRQKGELLEIGVGSGALLDFMRNDGFDVRGCDISRAICKHVEESYGISIYNDFVCDLPLNVKYDVIVMNHVLEHVSDPIKLLQDIHARLNQNALLHVAVPNLSSWEAVLPGWTNYEPYHLLYFTAETLKMALEKAGFRVLLLKTHESFSGWFLAILRTVLKTYKYDAAKRRDLQKMRRNSWIENAYHIAMIVSGGLSYPFRYVQGKMGCGDELIAVAQPANYKMQK